MRSLIVGCLFPLAASEHLSPSDERVLYVGRFWPSKDGSVQYSAWGGTQVKARFNGTSVSAKLSGGEKGDRFLTLIDGQPHGDPFVVAHGSCSDFPDWADSEGDTCSKIVSMKNWCQYALDYAVNGVSAQAACCGCGGGNHGLPTYKLADGLREEGHEVSLWKITEDGVRSGRRGVATFGGLIADSFGPAPLHKPYKLEFIGDSDTAGWCADGSSSSGDVQVRVENTYKTWASKIARAFDADFVEQAVSGIGVEDSKPIRPLLKNVLPWDDSTPWDFTSWVPDAVVMLIGPNDDLSDIEVFQKAYRATMDTVVSHYGGAQAKPKIVHVCAGSINGFDPCASIQTVSEEFNTDRSDGFVSYYTSIARKTWELINGDASYQGCDSHYNDRGHQAVADEIIPQLKAIMTWETDTLIIVT